MSILISTAMYHSDNFKNILHFIERYNGKVGAEIFPRFDEKGFEQALRECVPALKQVDITIHEPYFEVEHTADFESAAYRKTIYRLSSMIKYGSVMGCEYIVYHHNNCAVAPEDREKLIKTSQDNLYEVSQLLLPYNIAVAVENAGTLSKGTMLLSQEEYISLVLESPCLAVIDIGHINANGWDMERVITALKHKITAYHIHNNHGKYDEHNRIFDGTLDFNRFMELYMKHTPGAKLVLEYSAELADKEEDICRDIDYITEIISNADKALA